MELSSAALGPLLNLAVFIIIGGFISYKIWRFRRSIMGQALQILARSIVTGEGITDEEETSATPKSLSSMDSLYIPRIEKDFPEFSWNEWRSRIQNAVVLRMQAIDERAPELLSEYPVIMKEVETLITNDSEVSSGMAYSEDKLEYKNRYAYKTVVSGYLRGAGACTIHAQTSASYERKVKVGTKANASKESDSGWKMRKIQTVFHTELVYVQDAEKTQGKMLGYNCPNCGAPVKGLGSKVCPYCGTGLESLNIRVWTINKIVEDRK
ncbi:zinc ribbon domain-containing protein [Oribacterium sp. FC2011]|uniref:zinc ribbon domain-containing protein n=1 Tax=Oribacterium sp. FC2011 TaxID=1408311 RepID=UPI0004E13C6E|nr:zinc ribbon domain-containing protein [Oribacterium sp. FC2011]